MQTSQQKIRHPQSYCGCCLNLACRGIERSCRLIANTLMVSKTKLCLLVSIERIAMDARRRLPAFAIPIGVPLNSMGGVLCTHSFANG